MADAWAGCAPVAAKMPKVDAVPMIIFSMDSRRDADVAVFLLHGLPMGAKADAVAANAVNAIDVFILNAVASAQWV